VDAFLWCGIIAKRERGGLVDKAQDAAGEILHEVKSTIAAAAPISPGTPGSGTPTVKEPVEAAEPLPPKLAEEPVPGGI